MRKILMISTVLLALAAAAGCGNDPDVSQDTSPAPVATVAQGQPSRAAGDPGEAASAYMEAIAATNDPEAMRDGLDQAHEGSTAYVYLAHRANLAESFLDGGTPIDAYDLTAVGDGFELCDPNGTGDEACGAYTDFEAVDGKVSDFTVDGEEPGPRLTAGNGETVEDRGVTAEFLTAYDAVAGTGLWVTMRVASGSDPVDVWLYEATYRAPDGGQRQATDAYGPNDLGADSNATVTLVFSGVEPGGVVTLEGVDSTDYISDYRLEIHVG